LLTEPEQRAFRRLSVFAAGCTLAGAEAVVADEAVHQPDAVVGLVNRLVVASLLRPDQRTTPRRYQMLDTIREYADERLAESGETELARARQLDYFVGLAMQVRIEERLGPQPRQLMTLLDAEHDNIREALQRLLDDEDGEAALRLASAMGTYWNERGYWGEGRRWLLRALDLTKGARTLDRARGLLALAETTSSFAGIAAATPQLEESIAICREHDHPILLGITLLYLSNAHGWNHDQAARDVAFTKAKEISAKVSGWWVQAGFDVYSSLGRVLDGEFEEAHRGLVAAADSLVRNGDDAYAARTLMYAGNVARMMGDLPSARDDLERSIDLSEADIVRGTRAHSALTLAQISLELGDPEAPARFGECMAELERIGDERCLATCMRTLGSLALDDGRPDDALAYFRSGLDGLALHDQRSLAVALGDIARIEAERGDTDAAATLATAARVYAERSGSPLTNAETDRLAAVTRTYGNGSDEVDLEAALELARHAG
jgi:tetratricopeptide (TPR) repeat protein